MKEMAEVRELKENRYIIIDNEPSRIVSISTSKPGKHGEAKARIEAIGVFDGQKRSVIYPVRHKVSVPIMDKRNAQVLAIKGDAVELMDLETYETFEMKIPDEFKDKIKEGENIGYIQALGKRKITKV
ncbi:MAG: translation initiation factor IF-5A [Thermoplasmata archaeon]|nr:MAG: translation initiation factor IF-5A [Thermoplasmata archaeon]RLF40977.1 MAG: translation initiation factor IF-5A [Thermoplasmata archaeon]RLF58528.1 MAG: translation initiation factor IF-5A [Thermoplasmata archaeon]HDN50225.1 translation initiation factor IF-5A [Thermoplasmatales archaeon]